MAKRTNMILMLAFLLLIPFTQATDPRGHSAKSKFFNPFKYASFHQLSNLKRSHINKNIHKEILGVPVCNIKDQDVEFTKKSGQNNDNHALFCKDKNGNSIVEDAPQTFTITGTSEDNNRKIEFNLYESADLQVTLDTLTLKSHHPIKAYGQGKVTLILKGKNTIQAKKVNNYVKYNYPAIECDLANTGIVIKEIAASEDDANQLIATGSPGNPGIGTTSQCNYITINSGYIVASDGEPNNENLQWAQNEYQHSSGAGIGTGTYGTLTSLTISGGKVYATGGFNAAGIGAGPIGYSEYITINGGFIDVTAGKYGAGIGAGRGGAYDKSNVRKIDIYGSPEIHVTCLDQSRGAGIGGGYGDSQESSKVFDGIYISGGTIDIYIPDNGHGAGIGAGHGQSHTSSYAANVRISGGTITSRAGYDSAGIGHGLSVFNVNDDNTAGVAKKLYIQQSEGRTLQFCASSRHGRNGGKQFYDSGALGGYTKNGASYHENPTLQSGISYDFVDYFIAYYPESFKDQCPHLPPTPTASPVPTATPTATPTASPVPTATPTATPTASPVPTATPTASPVPTATPLPPDPTATPVPPDPTATPAPPDPTATPAPPDPTATPVPPDPTATPAPPDPTATILPGQTPVPTATPAPPDPTATPVPPDPTKSPAPPDPTATPLPPDPTATPLPPDPTATPLPPAATATPLDENAQKNNNIDVPSSSETSDKKEIPWMIIAIAAGALVLAALLTALILKLRKGEKMQPETMNYVSNDSSAIITQDNPLYKDGNDSDDPFKNDFEENDDTFINTTATQI